MHYYNVHEIAGKTREQLMRLTKAEIIEIFAGHQQMLEETTQKVRESRSAIEHSNEQLTAQVKRITADHEQLEAKLEVRTKMLEGTAAQVQYYLKYGTVA